jgi:hypothetical protein
MQSETVVIVTITVLSKMIVRMPAKYLFYKIRISLWAYVSIL